jgi:hypothetical protein
MTLFDTSVSENNSLRQLCKAELPCPELAD